MVFWLLIREVLILLFSVFLNGILQTALNKKPIVLVGKGIVYDTGGLNIKTGDYMAGMNGDMAGAATVTGVLYTAARTDIPLHIIGLGPFNR